MRVLWVEDFGDGLEPDAILAQSFRDVISQQRRNKISTHLRKAETENQTFDQWRIWYRKHQWVEEPEIDVCRNDKEFDELTGQCVADRYDAVLLDINLTNDFFSIPPCDSEKGGFWLYNKLIRQGFPSGRIALLTAYDTTDDTTAFRKDCERFGHEKLEAHSKNNSEAGLWIKKLSDSHEHYLLLRRAILDGIDFCDGLLRSDGSESIRFNRYIKDDGKRWTLDHATDFLCSLRHLLPISITLGDKHLQLRGFIYLLGCEWDKADPNGGSDQNYKALGCVMKTLRNMASHGHMLDKAGVSDLAFFALACFRACFLTPGRAWEEPEPYELDLISLMGAPASLDTHIGPSLLARSYCDARSILKAAVASKEPSVTRKNDKGKPVPVQDQDQYFKIINELITAKRPPSFDFISILKGIFIHEALGVTTSDCHETDLKSLIDTYRSSFEKQLAEMPPWSKLVWERIFNPSPR